MNYACGSGKQYQYCCGALRNVLPFRRRSDFEQVWELWGMVSSFAESSEMALQRERAWNFFREECLCGIEPAPESMQSFLDWFILEYPLEEGDTVLSLFVKDNCRYLSCAQLEVLKSGLMHLFLLPDKRSKTGQRAL